MIKIKFKPSSPGANINNCFWAEESFVIWKNYVSKLIKEGRCFIYSYPGEELVNKPLNQKFPMPIGKVFKLDFIDGKADVEFVHNFNISIFNEVMLSSEKTFIGSITCCELNELNEIIPPISCMGFYLHLP